MTERLGYIDSLKGLAMTLVVAGHIIVFCGLGYDNIYVDNIVMINMPLFLFLNGFVVREWPVNGLYQYLAKKFYQIIIPFLSWGCIITLYRHSSYTNFLFDFWKFGYWYLLVLFEFYLIYGGLSLAYQVVNKIIKNENLKNINMIFLMIFGYFVIRVCVRFLPSDILSLTSYFQILEYYPFFFLGVLVKAFSLQSAFERNSSTVMTILLISTPLAYFAWAETDNRYALLSLRVLGIFLLLMLGILFYHNNKNTERFKLFRTIGKHSLAIYMIQFYLFGVLNFRNLYEFLDKSGNGLVIFVFTTLCSILLCYLCIAGEYLICTSRLLSMTLLGKYQKTNYA